MLQKPLGLQFDFESPKCTLVEQINVGDVPDLAKDLPYKDQILAELHRTRKTYSVKGLTEALGLAVAKEASIRTTLTRNKKLFAKGLDERWSLLAHQEV